jgi:hypothetical protein
MSLRARSTECLPRSANRPAFLPTPADFAATLAALRRKLSPGGTLNILQPNYRYAYREYFDDNTHVAVYSHISLADFLAANG